MVDQLERRTLSAGYYEQNFKKLIKFIVKTYGDILRRKEKKFIANYLSLPVHGRRLYVRLASRTKNIFVESKLSYQEINIKKGIQQLQDLKFIGIEEKIDLPEILELHPKTELQSAIKILSSNPVKGLSKLSRDETCDILLHDFAQEAHRYFLEKDRYIQVFHLDLVEIFLLLFFGNLEQSLSDFILEDIGVLKYEPFKLAKKMRLFSSRKNLLNNYKLILLGQEMAVEIFYQDANAIKKILKSVDKIRCSKTILKRKKDRILYRGAYFLERNEETNHAIKWYKKCLFPPARERLARVYFDQGKWKKSLFICQEILVKPLSESEREFAQIFSNKIKRKQGDKTRVIRKLKFDEEVIFLKLSNQSVEEDCLSVFQQQGYKGFYLENYLWNGLFGLAFWDIIFMPMEGVFFNPFQRGPLDLFEEQFYDQRSEPIERRLNLIKAGKLSTSDLLQTYKKKVYTANHLVNWKKLEREHVKLVWNTVANRDITAILEKMAKDLKRARAGFPDLFILHPKTKEYFLVEVKGPRDTLQESQRRWLKYFQEQGIPFKVARVKDR